MYRTIELTTMMVELTEEYNPDDSATTAEELDED